MHGAGLVGGAGRALALASARTGAREKVQGRSPRGFVARRNSNGLFSHSGIFFPIAPVDFQSIRGRGGEGRGAGSELFSDFFFSRVWGAGRGGGGTPKPEARVARFLVGMFRNRFFEAGVDAKVSPRVAKGRQSVTEGGGDEKVSPLFFKLLIFFISAGKCRSESATGLAGARGDDGGRRRDLEKHCGRTLFSILSMDRLID